MTDETSEGDAESGSDARTDDESASDARTDDESAADAHADGDAGAPTAPATRADAPSAARVREMAREYEREGRPYASVTVVRREPPVSAHVGDRALVTADGEVVGWIGGAECAQSVAVDVARDAIESGEAVLIGLAPDPSDIERSGMETYPMTCHSGGTLELFVEPVTPAPGLVVVGESPIARSLVRQASELGFDVTVVAAPETERDADERGEANRDATDDRPDGVGTVPATDARTVADAIAGARYVVVASMGEYDELGVEAALRAGAGYVGLVASDRRRDDVAGTVAERFDGDADAVAAALTTPAGIDVGAETPEEIALSILAELVAVRRGAEGAVEVAVADASARDWTGETAATSDGTDETSGPEAQPDARTVVDPVCGMDVETSGDAPTVEYDGETYYFCGQGCADAFAEDPGDYVEPEVDADV